MLESRIVMADLPFFGHVVRSDDGIVNDAGKNGRSARKRQTTLHLARQYKQIFL